MKDITERLRWHCTCAWRGVSVPCIACESTYEMTRLRDLVHRWKNAAEAYERGSLGTGDRLIEEARKVANRG